MQRLHRLITLTFLLLPVHSAIAQSADGQDKGVTRLAPVVVTTEQAAGPVPGYVANQSGTASKTGASILQTPQSISVIGRAEMTNRNVQTTTQALQYLPGVASSTQAINSRFDGIQLRGFGVDMVGGVLIDGLRATSAQSYTQYQPYGAERIEVLRGPSGFLYGAGSPGGTVNMISKRPTAEPLREVGFQFGSHRRLQAQFDVSGPLNDDKTLLYRLVGVGRNADTQFNHVPDDTGYIAPSFTWRPSPSTALTLLGSHSRSTFGPPRPFLPIQGTLLPNPNGKIPRNQYLDGTDLDNYRIQSDIGYLFDHSVNDAWSFHSSAKYAYIDVFTQTLSGMGLAADMRTLNRNAFEFDVIGKVFANDNHAKLQWNVDGVKGTSVLGLSWRNTREDYYLNGGGPAAPIDVYNPAYGAAFSVFMPFAKTDQQSREYGAYTAHTLELNPHWMVDFAARQDWVSTNTDNKLTNARTRQKDDDATYRVGLSYVTDLGLAPYASYATAFAPVLGVDFYGNPYRPTRGKQFEVGAKYQPNEMDALFTAAWFHLVQDNIRTTDPTNPLNQIQTGEVTSKGIELSAVANITTHFKTRASYTYNQIETTQTTIPGAQGKTPTGLPKHTASLWADVTLADFLPGLGVGLGARYVGSTYADTANTLKAPSVTLVDAAIRYDFGRANPALNGLQLAVHVGNLFDKHYYSCAGLSCSEGFARAVQATVRYRW